MQSHKRLYCITFFEKFTVNGFRALLVLYAIHHLKMTTSQAFECIGAALGLGFLTPVLGGLLADWLRDAKIVIIGGLILMIASSFSLLLLHNHSDQYFCPYLALLVLGMGLVRPNVPVLLGKFQPLGKTDVYSQFYICINLGSLLGILCCGTISEIYGWRLSFVLSIIASTIALYFALSLPSAKSHTSKHDRKNYTDFLFVYHSYCGWST